VTYATLKVDVDSWLARDDIAVSGTSIDSITLAAEAWLGREVYPMGFQKFTSLSLTGRSVAVPADYKSGIALYLDVNQTAKITYLTPELIRQSSVWTAGSGSSPMYYTIEAIDALGTLGFTFAPAGGSPATTIYLQYHGDLPSIITAAGGTNVLLTRGYDVYLWSMLAAGARWAQMFEIADGYDARALAAIASFNKAEMRRRFAGNALVASGNRQVV
jgi:hypothetical protein